MRVPTGSSAALLTEERVVSAQRHPLSFHQSGGEVQRHDVGIGQAVIAGWTGRDVAAMEKHIDELEALGVQRPTSTPLFYRVAAARITTGNAIEVIGTQSGGEVEFVLLKFQNRLWVGTGSDHTDREAETYRVSVSKQMCDKPIAPEFWLFDDVAEHWDQLILRSFLVENEKRVLYQEGTVAAIRRPEELISLFTGGRSLAEGTLMFCGTLAAIGGVRPTNRFVFEIDDPVRRRKIEHGYEAMSLPMLG